MSRDDAKMAAALLRHKADPNLKCGTLTPLAMAASKAKPELLELLLAAGADTDARDDSGFTPLARAAFYGKLDNAGVFLKHGADINTREAQGYTPLLAAAARGRCEDGWVLAAFQAGLGDQGRRGAHGAGVGDEAGQRGARRAVAGRGRRCQHPGQAGVQAVGPSGLPRACPGGGAAHAARRGHQRAGMAMVSTF